MFPLSFFERASCAELTLVLCIYTASPVLAEEVLYCVDTDSVGFAWDKNGKAKSSKFNFERHTVKVVSETERLITRMQGDTAGKTVQYECTQYDEVVTCHEPLVGLGDVWHFYRDAHTRISEWRAAC